ncbi:MAG TPA: hypothetical protein VFO11_12420, partial [Candidatus Polarisedimenticolaceae bacterium]|nr:hypothetical protein [Candidatus Polarisedimenticolaceae bacterium]
DLTGGRTLSTGGTTTWSGTGSIRLGSGGNIQNAGIWDVQGNATMVLLTGGGGFTNPVARTLRKSAGGGLTTFDVAVTNGGTVAVESGTLSLDAGSTSSGAYNGTPGTTLRFGGGMHDLGSASSVSAATVAVTSGSVTVDGTYTATSTMVSAGTLTFSPSATVSAIGALSVSGTGTLTLNSGEAITPPTLSVTNGTIGGSDAVSVSGTFTWSGGTLTGNGTTTAPMGIAISSGTFKDLTGGRTLSTSGSIDWTGSGSVRVGGGAKIINNGTWTLQSDAFLSDLGSAGTFANTSGATFRKAAGAGTSQIVVPFTNAGTVRASAGTLQFGGSYTQTAGTTLLDGGTLAGTVPLLLQGGTLAGSGTVAAPVTNSGGTLAPGQSAGTLSLGGTYTQGGAATLAIELGGLTPGTQHDRVDVAGATTLAGTLQVSLINGFVPAAGSTFTVLTFPSSTGTFSASNLPPLPNIVWLVRYNPTSVVLEAAGDQDEDGTPNGSDCAPSDPTAWGVPAEVTGAGFGANKQTLSWTSQAIAAGPSTLYDVVRGSVALLPVGSGGETCLTPGTATAQTSDATLPAVGTGSYYLVRARNVCAVGTYGTRTGGVPRTTAACP